MSLDWAWGFSVNEKQQRNMTASVYLEKYKDFQVQNGPKDFSHIRSDFCTAK